MRGLCFSNKGIYKFETTPEKVKLKELNDNTGKGYDNYRPIFWFKDKDKEEYNNIFNIENSKCYTEYGLKRTGCVGCPYSRDCQGELQIVKDNEPKLAKAIENVFKDAYEYTKKYNEFKNKK